MIWATKIIVLTPLLFFFAPLSSRAQKPSERGRVRTARLSFHLSHDTLIVIRGSIDRLHNLRFVLDTGTTQTIVDRRVSDHLHLSCLRESSLMNFNRSLELKLCALPDLEIGPFRFKGLTVHVARLTRLSSLLDDADVVVGLDVLGASKFTIDYASDEVEFQSLNQPPPPPTQDPDDPICMTAVIQVQGHPVRLILDTGVQGVLLYEDRLRSSVPHLRIVGKTEEVNIGGRMPAERITLPGVRLGSTKMSLVVLLISSPPKHALRGIDGYLGVSELKARRVTFDFVKKTLTWER